MTERLSDSSRCTILLVSGSLRKGSSNTAALEAARALAPSGTSAVIYQRMVELPAFNPDVEQTALPEPVVDLRAQLARADAVMFSTPEYAGSLPGSFKNLLDWCVGEGLYRKPVGWLNPSPHAEGAERAYQVLRVVLGYMNADLVEPACVRIALRRDAIAADGSVQDADIRREIATAVRALVEHVRAQRESNR